MLLLAHSHFHSKKESRNNNDGNHYRDNDSDRTTTAMAIIATEIELGEQWADDGTGVVVAEISVSEESNPVMTDGWGVVSTKSWKECIW